MSKSIEELIEEFDYTDPETCERLYEAYAALRERSAAVYSPKFGGHWVVTRYEEIVNINKDTSTYTNTGGVTIPDVGNEVRTIPLEVDPPEHTKYRRFLGPRFRKAEVDKMDPTIRRIVLRCLNEIRESGRCDLVPALTEQVPSIVIADLLGLPEKDWDAFRAWTVEMQRTAYEGDSEANAKVAQQLGGYLAQAIESRRGVEEDDGGILHQLANGLVEGESIPPERALGMSILLLMAGHETTAHAGAAVLHLLATEPGVRERLLADPEQITPFVNEALRYEGSVTGMSRTATCPHQLDGNDIAEGDKLLLLYTAANHDPRVYSNPDSFDMDRNERSHLAFGYGAHRCLGEQVAILELKVIVSEVLRVMPDYELVPGFQLEHTPWVGRGPVALPVTFTPSPREEIAPSAAEAAV
jgi:cytochrome P450